MVSIESMHLRLGSFSIKDVTFEIAPGAHVVLMGRTGSGKTSILEVICGLRQPQAGVVRVRDRDVTHLPPWARAVAYVPQDRALFDTMNVRDNIGFALRVRRDTDAHVRRTVDELAELLGIAHLLDRATQMLSGGEAGRVALARALAPKPALILLDEPLAALDETTAEQMISTIKTLRCQTHATILHVTHRRTEADRLADRILVLSDGRLGEARHNPDFIEPSKEVGA